MQFKFLTAVLAAGLAIVVAQDIQKEEYQLNPKFPDYAKLNKKLPVPETPEVPEIPEHKEHEVPKFEKPDVPEFGRPEYPKVELPKYERPETPEYKVPEVPGYHAPTYPSIPEYPDYVYTHPSPYYYGRPDFSATHPPMVENKEEEEEDVETSTEPTMTAGDGSSAPDSKMEEKMDDKKKKEEEVEEEEKEGDNTTPDSKAVEEKKEEKKGVPVFNFHEYELPHIGEHNFDDFTFNLTVHEPRDANNYTDDDDDYFKIQRSHEVPVAKTHHQPVYDYDYYPSPYPVPGSFVPEDHHRGPVPTSVYPPQGQRPVEYPYPGKPNFNVPSYPGEYQRYPTYQPDTGAHQQQNVVEKEGSYYRLDTCEYRFILDMVQCHEVERHSEKVKVHSQGQGSHHQGQGPYYYNYNYNPAGQGRYPYQAPYDSRYSDFMRLYGNPMYYADHHNGHSYKPGHFDDSLFSYSPSVGHPFYAPGLHNTPFAKYYAGFRAGHFEQSHEAETRQYHKEAHYQSALQDFNNLQLQKVVKLDSESETSVKTSSKVSVSDEAGYEGYTPAFDYKVRLLPNHCSVPGYGGRHTCIVFSGATHPYRMVHRQFIYLKNTREVQSKYRQRYEDSQRVQY